MIPTVLACDDPEASAAVRMALETGRTLVFPTDTVYGIGGNPWDGRTLAHVRRLKNREAAQPFTLHLPSVSAIERYAVCTPATLEVVRNLLPGPYTLLLPASSAAPASTVSEGRVGIRVPDHLFFRLVVSSPLFGTSVNLHGCPPLNDVADIIEAFSEVDLVVTGSVTGIPSAIIDLTSRPAEVLRGVVPESVRRLLEQQEPSHAADGTGSTQDRPGPDALSE